MDKRDLRIGFLGTPDFAVCVLEHLLECRYNIVVVVTMPDKPFGRGQHEQVSPVKLVALKHSIPVLQPTSLKDENFLSTLRNFRVDLQIVVAFRMLPEAVWAMPPYGTFNLHASLLPQYRGAAPINWAIINGEKTTGVTTFMLKKEIDTGDIILQQKVEIAPNDNAGSLHDKLAETGKYIVAQTADLVLSSINTNTKITLHPQNCNDKELKPAPKLYKENTLIDFTKCPEQVCNFIRGLSPTPGAWCSLILGGIEYDYAKIFKAEPIEITHYKGSIETIKGHIILPCKNGYVDILELQLPNKKRMTAKSLLNGLQTDR